MQDTTMKLQTKILLIVLPLILTAIFGLGLWSSQQARNSLYGETIHYLELIVKIYSVHLQRWYRLSKVLNLEHIELARRQYHQRVMKEIEEETASTRTIPPNLFVLHGEGYPLFSSQISDLAQLTPWKSLAQQIVAKNSSELFSGYFPQQQVLYVAYRFEPWNWVIFCTVPEQEVTRAANIIYRTTFSVATLYALGTIVLMLFLSHYYLLLPIATLKTAASNIALQQPLIDIPLYRNDELGQLARDMENMSIAIATYRNQLNEYNSKLEHEITERNQAQAALKQQKEILQTIVDNIPIMIGLHDDQGQIQWINHEWERVWDRRLEDLKGKDLLKEFYPDQNDAQQVLDYLSLSNPRWCDFKQITPTGRALDVSWIHTRLSSGDIISFGQDITERKQAERLLKVYNQTLEHEVLKRTRALRQSEEQFRTLTQTTTAGILISNRGKIIYSNPAAQEFLGYTEEQLMNMNGFDIIHPDFRHLAIQWETEPSHNQVAILHYDLKFIRPDGAERWGNLSVAPFKMNLEPTKLITFIDITEHKRTEAALRTTTEQLSLILEQLPIVPYTCEPEGYFVATYMGPTAKTVTGYDPENFTRDSQFWLAHLHPQDKDNILSKIDNLFVKGYHQHEYRWQVADGSYKWFLDTLRLVNSPEGRKEYIIGAWFDITERKQMEQALRESEERFNLAMRGTNEGLWDWNLETNQMYYSPRWKQMLGFTEEEMSNQFQEFTSRLHPDDVEKISTTITAYLEKKQATYEVTFRMQHKQGYYIWILTRGIGIWDSQGTPLRMIGTHMDLTLQKQAEEALRHSEERLRRYFEQPFIGMATSSLSQGLIQVNDKFCQMLGYSRQELCHMDWAELTHPGDIAADIEQFKRVITREINHYTLDKRYIRKDGQTIYASIAFDCIRDVDGNVDHFVVLVQDITERKQFEIRLQKAKESAEVANRAKSQFLANMSHELRTPLNGILGYTQILLRHKELNSKQREGLEIIQRSGEYLLTLISDILDLSKIEAGKLTDEPIEFNFTEFLQSIVDLMKMRAEQKDLQFQYEPLSTLPTFVYADEKKLRQVLLNLLSNAVKFTQQGQIYFQVSYSNNQANFVVRDTGRGIGAADLSEIFKPFQQAGDQREQIEGTGLGLSISKRLVEIMGGQLFVESQIKQGSSFWFEIKLPEVQGMVTQPPVSPTIIGYEGKPRQILIVDDQWENRSILVHLLDSVGFSLLEANQGKQALRLAYKHLPDAILTDLRMPEMDGFELIRRVRRSAKLNSIVVIAVSATVSEQYQYESLTAGFQAFITKPIHTEHLFKTLKKHLQLNWIYKDHQPTLPLNLASGSDREELIGPSPSESVTLYELMMTGNVRQTSAHAMQLAQQDEKLKPFAERVQFLAKNYEIAKLENLIKHYL
jgi:PAS domain S-box-containing protein